MDSMVVAFHLTNSGVIKRHHLAERVLLRWPFLQNSRWPMGRRNQSHNGQPLTCQVSLQCEPKLQRLRPTLQQPNSRGTLVSPQQQFRGQLVHQSVPP